MNEEKPDRLREYIEGVNDFSETHRIELMERVRKTYDSVSEFIDYSG
jgi:RNase P subunit RPR2